MEILFLLGISWVGMVPGDGFGVSLRNHKGLETVRIHVFSLTANK